MKSIIQCTHEAVPSLLLSLQYMNIGLRKARVWDPCLPTSMERILLAPPGKYIKVTDE